MKSSVLDISPDISVAFMPSSRICLTSGAIASGAAVEHDVRVLALDLRQDGLEVVALFVGAVRDARWWRRLPCGLLELVCQTLAVGRAVVNDGNVLVAQRLTAKVPTTEPCWVSEVIMRKVVL